MRVDPVETVLPGGRRLHKSGWITFIVSSPPFPLDAASSEQHFEEDQGWSEYKLPVKAKGAVLPVIGLGQAESTPVEMLEC